MTLTVLDALTKSNPIVDNSRSKGGPNTVVYTEIHAASWRPWSDFQYDVLAKIFKEQLKKPYSGPRTFAPLEEDLRIYAEDTLEDVLSRFVVPIVNRSLAVQKGQGYYGRGSRCPRSTIRPDWSLTSPAVYYLLPDQSSEPVNLTPGDTKLHKKWRPEMRTRPEQFVEWQKVVDQVVKYSMVSETRCGFIATEKNLVVLRITRMPDDAGLAMGRPERTMAWAGTTSGPPRGPRRTPRGRTGPKSMTATSCRGGSTFISFRSCLVT